MDKSYNTLGFIFGIGLLLTAHLCAANENSTCFGTTKRGKLEHGVRLPVSGANFEAYSLMAAPLGRIYVHSQVRKVILEAYADLAKRLPGKKYKFAETGFEHGGRFKPHKTHQNGLSVDFIVPVVNERGESVYLPTNIFNKWGYAIEFDKQGRYKNYRIDFESMAAHIVSLDKAARKNGIAIWRVIFDPKLQPYLFKTTNGAYIKRHIKTSKKRSWVRHDEHYHIDFSVKCKPLRRY